MRKTIAAITLATAMTIAAASAATANPSAPTNGGSANGGTCGAAGVDYTDLSTTVS